MFSHGFNWWKTKHGRARFIERFGKVDDATIEQIASDGEIIQTPWKGEGWIEVRKNGWIFIWAPDRKYPVTGKRLVTVKIDYRACIQLTERSSS